MVAVFPGYDIRMLWKWGAPGNYPSRLWRWYCRHWRDSWAEIGDGEWMRFCASFYSWA